MGIVRTRVHLQLVVAQQPPCTCMCMPKSKRRLASPAPVIPASRALSRAWCRYWVAAVQNFDNTWVVNFSVFQDVYGTGGLLAGADVNGLIPKTRMWLVAVYWALTTVQAPLHLPLIPSCPKWLHCV